MQVNTLCDGREQLIAPASSFHLPSTSHCRCANTAGYVNVGRVFVPLKRELLFSINPDMNSYVLATALKVTLRRTSSKPYPVCVCVYFFPPQGEYNILLFLRLDSESESAPTGAGGSHGSSALSQ